MSRIYVQNETEDANNSVFNMKTTINESRTLRNQISCECKFKFDGRNAIQIQSDIAINAIMSAKIQENFKCVKKSLQQKFLQQKLF